MISFSFESPIGVDVAQLAVPQVHAHAAAACAHVASGMLDVRGSRGRGGSSLNHGGGRIGHAL